MQAAPTPVIDALGVATWENVPLGGGAWVLTTAFDDGTYNWYNPFQQSLADGINTFDSHYYGVEGGHRLLLMAVDADDTVILAPTASIGCLTIPV